MSTITLYIKVIRRKALRAATGTEQSRHRAVLGRERHAAHAGTEGVSHQHRRHLCFRVAHGRLEEPEEGEILSAHLGDVTEADRKPGRRAVARPAFSTT